MQRLCGLQLRRLGAAHSVAAQHSVVDPELLSNAFGYAARGVMEVLAVDQARYRQPRISHSIRLSNDSGVGQSAGCRR